MNKTSKFVDECTRVDNFVLGGPGGKIHVAVIAINNGIEDLFEEEELIDITDKVLDFNEKLFEKHDYLFKGLTNDPAMVNKISENVDELIFREGGKEEIKEKLKQHLKEEIK